MCVLRSLGFFYYLLKAALLAWLVLPQTKVRSMLTTPINMFTRGLRSGRQQVDYARWCRHRGRAEMTRCTAVRLGYFCMKS